MVRRLLCSGGAALAVTSVALGQGRMIAVDSGRALYEIDITTGTKTQIGTVTTNASTTAGLAYDAATGTVYLTSTGNDSLFTLDVTTGVATLVGAYGDPALVMHGLEFDDRARTLYGGSNGNLYAISTSTGAATLVGTSGLSSFTNLVYNSATDTLYATNSGTDSFYLVDRSTGAMTLIGPLAGPTNPNGVAYNRDDGRLYMVDNSTDTLYTIDPVTGTATAIGSTGPGNLLGLVYIPSAPPVCYPNCDGSTGEPVLNVNDFICFQNRFAASEPYADCDQNQSLNVNDFICFQNAFAAGCR